MELGIEDLGEQKKDNFCLMFESINDCHNVKDFRNLAKKDYQDLSLIILMEQQMMKLLTVETLKLMISVI